MHLQQGTPEWLEFRSTRIGASDSAKILGLSPYGSAFDLYLEKTGQKESNFNPAMSYGNRMEPLVRAYYEEKVGEWFPPAVVTHPDYDWLIASLDGISSDNKRILEIKTCNAQVFEDAQRGEIPKYYYCQAQHQLFCTPKARDVEFVFYHKGNYCHVIITPDDDFVSDMIPRLLEFYENCIVNRLPPSMSERDSVDMSEDCEWMCLSAEAKMLYPEYQESKKKWDAFKSRVLDATDDGNCHGGCLKVTRSWKKGGVDLDKMKADGIDVDKYRKSPSSSIRITVSKQDNNGSQSI